MCELKEKAKETRTKKENSLEKGYVLVNICMMFIYHSVEYGTPEEIPLTSSRGPIIAPYDVCHRQIAPDIVNLYSLTG